MAERRFNKIKTRGSQTQKIESIMRGEYANMVTESVNNRMKGLIVGFVGGAILGALFRQNTLASAGIGGLLGFVLTMKRKDEDG
jgi:hypothetical protein